MSRRGVTLFKNTAGVGRRGSRHNSPNPPHPFPQYLFCTVASYPPSHGTAALNGRPCVRSQAALSPCAHACRSLHRPCCTVARGIAVRVARRRAQSRYDRAAMSSNSSATSAARSTEGRGSDSPHSLRPCSSRARTAATNTGKLLSGILPAGNAPLCRFW